MQDQTYQVLQDEDPEFFSVDQCANWGLERALQRLLGHLCNDPAAVLSLAAIEDMPLWLLNDGLI